MAKGFDLQGVRMWPTMIFNRDWVDHEKWVDGIVDELYERKAKATSNIESQIAVTSKSMDGLYESTFDLFETEHEGLSALRDWIAGSVAKVVEITSEQKYKEADVEVVFKDAWSHISNDGGYHDAHYHGNCSWCGIFYVKAAQCHGTDKTGAGNGISRFYSPIGTGALSGDIGNEYLSANRLDFTPRDGALVIFPAFLLHAGLPYRGEDDRILIAFNTQTVLRAKD